MNLLIAIASVLVALALPGFAYADTTEAATPTDEAATSSATCDPRIDMTPAQLDRYYKAMERARDKQAALEQKAEARRQRHAAINVRAKHDFSNVGRATGKLLMFGARLTGVAAAAAGNAAQIYANNMARQPIYYPTNNCCTSNFSTTHYNVLPNPATNYMPASIGPQFVNVAGPDGMHSYSVQSGLGTTFINQMY